MQSQLYQISKLGLAATRQGDIALATQLGHLYRAIKNRKSTRAIIYDLDLMMDGRAGTL